MTSELSRLKGQVGLATSEQLLASVLPQSRKVVLVIDLVESVKLMQDAELKTVLAWQETVRLAREQVLNTAGGRIVKSLGDGLMAEFDTADSAVNSAALLHQIAASIREKHGFAPEAFFIRAGVHLTSVYRDDLDIYGHGVNLAARLASLARPGETFLSELVKEEIVDGVHGELHDMGMCFVKHVTESIRCYKINHVLPADRRSSSTSSILPERPVESLATTIAVLPFIERTLAADNDRANQHGRLSLGELISDCLIVHLSRAAKLSVISRLSNVGVRAQIEKRGSFETPLIPTVEYILEGTYLAPTGCEDPSANLILAVTLSHVQSNEIVWSDRISIKLATLFEPNPDAIMQIALSVQVAIGHRSTIESSHKPLPNLTSYSLLAAGIVLMHRSQPIDLERSNTLFDHLLERHPNAADAYAWCAKSYILKLMQSFGDPAQTGQQAINICHKALNKNLDSSLVLSVLAHAHTHIVPEPEKAKRLLDQAIQKNPSEPMAWLFQSVLQAMWGDSAQAVESARKALVLSPCDPQAYYFKMILGSALAGNGQFEEAEFYAKDSLRTNRFHAPTWRVLITAQAFADKGHDARLSFAALQEVSPGFSLAQYRSGPNAQSNTRRQFLDACHSIGITQ
jgi:adenylate cyclase